MFYYLSPIGWMSIEGNGTAISRVQFVDKEPVVQALKKQAPEYIEDAITQLKEYFDRKRQVFELPLAPEGTDFQKQVWEEIQKIPYGHTSTYLSMALRAFNREYSRAIGQAVGANPIAVIIPCHRMVASSGDLTGFAWGLDRKRSLLTLENELAFAPQTRLF